MPPNFAGIEPISLKDRVINALKDAFLDGQFKPGDAIVERELAGK
jgi:DNA-binding GntR family transcriptional regulator